MAMSIIDPDLVRASIKHCKELKGLERTEFIEEALVDYKWTAHIKSPREVQRHFRHVFTKLVKNFGH
tara:strand:- start:1470 stop:1670 length:201 start_codon:yes stop_codon:yes gene_type:complete